MCLYVCASIEEQERDKVGPGGVRVELSEFAPAIEDNQSDLSITENRDFIGFLNEPVPAL